MFYHFQFLDESQGFFASSRTSFVLKNKFKEDKMKIHISTERITFMTGFSLVLMAVIAGMTMGLVFNELFTTNVNEFKIALPGIESTFIWGLVAWFLILGLDLVVSWGIYRIYCEKNNKRARFVAILRLVYSVFLAVAISKLVQVYFLLTDSKVNIVQIFDLVHEFQSIWHFGLIIFGFHLIFLSKLVCDKKVILRIISLLLLLAGLGYVISNCADLLIENYEQIRLKVELVFIFPMIFGELGWGIWLMIISRKKINSQE